jgi:hypothetical protein
MTQADRVLSTPPTNTSAIEDPHFSTMTPEKTELRRDDRSPAHPAQVSQPTRRSFLMNTVVALPIAAALPVAAPAIDFPAPSFLPPPSPADTELLALVDEYIFAEAESERLRKIYNKLEEAFLDKGKPGALRVHPGDAELGIRAFIGRLGENHNSFNIDVLRSPKWPHPDAKVELAMGRIIAERLFKPSSQARARADEIIAASDQWQKTRNQKKPRSLLSAKRKYDKAEDVVIELGNQIAEMPATSIEGMIAKARCAQAYGFDPDSDDELSTFGASIVRDLLAMTAMPLTQPAAGIDNRRALKNSHDPAFALIAEKLSADVAHEKAIDAQGEFDGRRDHSSDAAFEAQEDSSAACHLVNEVDWKLATTRPTTLAGVAACSALQTKSRMPALSGPTPTRSVAKAGITSCGRPWRKQSRRS